jgi:hypothetical protein
MVQRETWVEVQHGGGQLVAQKSLVLGFQAQQKYLTNSLASQTTGPVPRASKMDVS